jgi:hypothetical protein
MKRISIFIFIVTAMFMAACNNYLDINTNPNQPTTATPNLILPQALVATASVLNRYNSYGSQIGGYASNAGGFGGFNEQVSYVYTTNNYSDLWPFTYDNLDDYQYIINQTKNDARNIYFYGVATIMRVYDFQLLVDTYNDIPYTQALLGPDNLTPAYDKGDAIYKAMAVELDSGIARINRGNAMATKNPIANYDVVFKGDMTKWIQLANTLKLKLMVRGNGKVTFDNPSFDPAGFLTTDALINPGYLRDINRQNPAWNTWAYTYTGTAGNKAWVPTIWILSWYDGSNLKDSGRGNAIYFEFGTNIANQLGVETVNAPKCPTGSRWYSGADRVGLSAGKSPGILKGPDAGYPLLTAAESYFLQAEGSLNGFAVGITDAAAFNNGIKASFTYLYSLPNGTVSGDPTGDATKYIANNTGKYLADYASASGNIQKLEAIITQKYIALNFVNSHEGWNEYRRTGYPAQGGWPNPKTSFASTVSQSSRTDKLPSRILYPTAEAQYNPANNPADISPFTSLIFWAK